MEQYRSKRKYKKRLHKKRKGYGIENIGRKLFQPWASACRDLNGNLISGTLSRWKDYFRTLLDGNDAEQNSE